MNRAVVLVILCFLAHPLLADYEVFYENGKAGIRDDAGNVLIPPAFDALGWSDGSFSVVNNVTGYRRNSRWGLINLKKELLTEPNYENLASGGGDRVVASRWINSYTKKFGCLDLNGNETVPFRYDAITILGLRAIACVKDGTRYEYGLIDLNDKTVLKTDYRDIRPVGSLRFAVQDFNRKTALFTEEGAPLTGFVIDSISSFRKGHALMYQDLKVGLLDRFGEIVLPATYRDIRIDNDGGITVRPFPLWKELDSRNTEVRTISADNIAPDGKYYRITVSGRQGTVNSELKTVIEPVYEHMDTFAGNATVARKDGKYGVINRNGKTIVPFEHDSLFMHNDLLRSMQVKMGQRLWSVYDTFGIRKTERNYEYLGPLHDRYFPAKRNGYWGAIDRYGREVVGCVYDSIINSSYDHVAVKFKGLYGLIDFQEKWAVAPQPNPLSLVNDDFYFEKVDSIMFVKDLTGQIIYFTTNALEVVHDGFHEHTPDGNIKFVNWHGISMYLTSVPAGDVARVFEESEGYRGVQRDGLFGFVDSRGRLRIANRYQDIGRFKQGLAPVKILGKWGYVNKDDNIVINPNYEQAAEFENGVSIVRRNGLYGVLSLEGKVLLPLRYDSILRNGEKLLIYSKSKVGLADLDGNVLIEPRFQTLLVVSGDLVLVSDGTLWGALTADGLAVIPMVYQALCYNELTAHFLAKEDKGWKPFVASEK